MPDVDSWERAALCGRFADVAEKIGRRVVQSAIWEGNSCTWKITTTDPKKPRSARVQTTLADGTLYRGTSGMALFLAELAKNVGTAAAAQTAVGGIRHALADAEGLGREAFGLHSGRVGIAYAALRAGLLLGEDFIAQASSVLEPLRGREHLDGGLDVINGSAGAIPALLAMSTILAPELCVEMACRLGDRLCDAAQRGPGGWSWGMTPSAVRGLCGYSHGASGMAHAFVELYQSTGNSRYRFAAEQALLYESSHFSTEERNWPDFRHKELSEYVSQGRLAELRRTLRAGKRLASEGPTYMSAWCHGAPGIALARLRAYEVLDTPQCLEEARIAVGTTEASLQSALGNYSLCHGNSGNSEALLVAAEVLGESRLWWRAAECASAGIALYEDTGRPWPCGTLGGISDPGLLVGESGIGYFMLRLVDSKTPSILLVRPEMRKAASPDGGEGYRAARKRSVEEYFGRTRAVFVRLGVDRLDREEQEEQQDSLRSPWAADLRATHSAIVAEISRERDPKRRRLMKDASLLDRTRYALAEEPVDLIEELTQRWVRSEAGGIDFGRVAFRLAPRVRIVWTGYDWDEWVLDAGPGLPRERRTAYLLRAVGGRILVHRLDGLAAAVLAALRQPGTMDGVTEAVARGVSRSSSPDDRDRLRECVRQQLASAYLAEIVAVSPVGEGRTRSPSGCGANGCEE